MSLAAKYVCTACGSELAARRRRCPACGEDDTVRSAIDVTDEQFATAAKRLWEGSRYNEGIEIDRPVAGAARTSRAGDGCWVAAWVWVPLDYAVKHS